MNYNAALDFIHSLSKFGSKPGLKRVSRLVSLVNNPQNSLKFIHIAGTSGKGSTANFCASILKEANFKVGLYTSPFIVDFRERFMINGQMISQEDFCRLTEYLIPYTEILKSEGEQITEFEFNTVLGFLWFKEQNCDVVCLEVGMGGRFDATNIIEKPLVSVITSIGLDHTDYLGNTIDKIAFEKCGIIKQGCPCVCYPLQKKDAEKVIFDICKQRDSKLTIPNVKDLNKTEILDDMSSYFYKGKGYTVNMAGEHQIYNSLTAIAAIQELNKKGFNITENDIIKGISSVKCPARLEIISKKPLIIIDGAHNADKISALYSYVKRFSGKIVAVCGMLKDKDYEKAAELIAPLCKKIITVTPQNPRALTSDELMKTVSQFCENCISAPSVSDGAKLAYSSLSDDDVLVCFGSLYIAGEVRQTILSII